MKCPNCGNEMVASRAGHLCLSCGHIESASATAMTAGIATGKDGHDQSRAAATDEPPTPAPAPALTSESPAAPEPPSTTTEPPATTTEPPAPESEPPLPANVTPPPSEPHDAATPAVAQTAASSAPAPAAPTTSEPAIPPTPLNGKPPLTPVTHPRPLRLGHALKLTSILIGSLIGVAGAITATFLYLIAPQTAFAGYLQNLLNTKTSSITASLTSNGPDSSYRLGLKLSGKADLTTAAQPKLDLDVSGSLSTTQSAISAAPASGELAGHVILADQALYFQATALPSLKGLSSIKPSADWYKYNLADANADKCLNPTLLVQIPVKQTAFLGFASLSGSPALHYRGALDTAKLKANLASADQKASAACQLSALTDQLGTLSVTYELWHGFSSDRLKLTVTDTSTQATSELMFDSNGYRQPAKIAAPTTAKDIQKLLADLQTQVKAAATAAAATTRDDLRKHSLSQLAAQATAYASQHHGIYPASAAILAQQPFADLDPTTTNPYQLISAGPTTLGQIQYLRSATCDTAGHVAKLKPTTSRAYALATLLEDGTTACLSKK